METLVNCKWTGCCGNHIVKLQTMVGYKEYLSDQYIINAKFSLQMFWPRHENKLMIQTQYQQQKPTTLYVCEFQVGFPLVWLQAYRGLS